MFVRFSTSASRFRSRTIRIPSLEDWLEISTISVVFFVFHKRCNIIQEFSNIGTDHGVRDLRDHQLLSAAFELHGLHFTSDTRSLPRSCLVNLQQVIFIYYKAACGKVRSFQIAHQPFDTDVVILHVGFYRIYHFTQIVRAECWLPYRLQYRLLRLPADWGLLPEVPQAPSLSHRSLA